MCASPLMVLHVLICISLYTMPIGNITSSRSSRDIVDFWRFCVCVTRCPDAKRVMNWLGRHDSTFLIRPSLSQRGQLVLSTVTGSELYELQLTCTPRGVLFSDADVLGEQDPEPTPLCALLARLKQPQEDGKTRHAWLPLGRMTSYGDHYIEEAAEVFGIDGLNLASIEHPLDRVLCDSDVANMAEAVCAAACSQGIVPDVASCFSLWFETAEEQSGNDEDHYDTFATA